MGILLEMKIIDILCPLVQAKYVRPDSVSEHNISMTWEAEAGGSKVLGQHGELNEILS